MEFRTKDGRPFTRERKPRAEQAEKAKGKSAEGGVKKALEQKLDHMEKQVHHLFQKRKSSKRRWDAESAL